MFIRRALAPLRSSRRTWCDGGVALIEVHGLDEADGQRLGTDVRERLEGVPGVAWAEAQHGTGRVGVAFDPALVALDALVAEVAAPEADGPPLRREGDHPADGEPLVRAATALTADLAGIRLATFGRVASDRRFPSRWPRSSPWSTTRPRCAARSNARSACPSPRSGSRWRTRRAGARAGPDVTRRRRDAPGAGDRRGARPPAGVVGARRS